MVTTLPRAVQDSLLGLADHYEIEGVLDRGANGYLFFAINKVTRQEVAIKFYAGEPGDGRHDEPRLLAQVGSANVLNILDARTISDEWAFFITPRCEGDLDDYIDAGPSAHDAIDVALGICSGASAIHAAGMLHRDLKPGNVVIHRGVPLIADFGSVRLLPSNSATVAASRHSILFRPPESFSTDTYSRQGDLYQIGVVTYQLLGGKLSYDGGSYLSTRDQIEYRRITDPVDQSIFVDNVIRRCVLDGSLLKLQTLPPWVMASTKSVIRRMTAPDPNDRFATLGEAAAALTRCRASLMNWQPMGSGARLIGDRQVIELRPTGKPDQFQVFTVRQGVAKRARKLGTGSLQTLVHQIE